MHESLTYQFLDCDFVQALLVARKNRLVYVSLGRNKATLLKGAQETFKKLGKAKKIDYYLLKDSKHSMDIMCEQYMQLLDGKKAPELEYEYMFGTDFQKKVWDQLVKIPSGTVKTYSEIAKEVGSSNSCRAVGRACGENKLAVLVPCHSVVGSSGKDLVGYRWGIDVKKRLLEREGVHIYK
ncbi:hypothetical protein KAFR_0H01690 [Kazachstania africana CBS 2517]|uniref:Methylated-DNA--protein-cysteine methyltransferase n=1 Tax=Kazachstania africana (strain ATCC 22294 / BCRC 22015 / CBS 2517 / CECT 1963 / NBRC 1671 / NRRL Y-8276) TaxID=1071382 RepID=H2AZ23_KAZAF|nr:hypothetical protein KAFR_0H01690 [Kazachstania africana CBS 2517]CCF59579.1 hypothetical protein KAFR_0H01690 [Kazachstania africana CBS 2517]